MNLISGLYSLSIRFDVSHRNIRNIFSNDVIKFNKEESRESDADDFDNLQPRITERKTHTLRTKKILCLQNDSRNTNSG